MAVFLSVANKGDAAVAANPTSVWRRVALGHVVRSRDRAGRGPGRVPRHRHRLLAQQDAEQSDQRDDRRRERFDVEEAVDEADLLLARDDWVSSNSLPAVRSAAYEGEQLGLMTSALTVSIPWLKPG
ncbi:hypothetical protein GGR47_000511 [Sphingomonas aquatilis]|uniref:Uncharacterized protein n=1 Tax=Sphingomonas aquatilis TaxID=93063 RepID=A0AAW3TS98_9SPHN|nr:hypothetical protein [Sphingomonas aquatilis]